ncbi:MAG: anthranilate synthase component I [Syntrophales bacterium]|nr:anthranilate synthase component I [Syntrophales bacterium]
MSCYPSYEQFAGLAAPGTMIPLYREILADTETPVTTLMKLRLNSRVFLLESVEGGEKWGRYTFLGSDPRVVYRVRGDYVEIEEEGWLRRLKHHGEPLLHLEELLARYKTVLPPGGDIPRFFGGAVGYLGYDMVRFMEDLPMDTMDDLHTADACFLIADGAVIFDNLKHTIKVVACACIDEGCDIGTVYDESRARIEQMIEAIQATLPAEPCPKEFCGEEPLLPAIPPEVFKDMVKKARDYIHAGDVIQVVLSQRFQKKNDADPIRLYRALRYINPSPYLFYLEIDDLALIGSSPEVMVRLVEGVAELRPIAGTRRRGRSEQEDRSLADELLRDPKERSEHVMLVDLGRNDLGKIARTGSVQVTQLMSVERYSHVMHLVSTVKAQLAPGKNCFHVLKAAFPAGTLTGAPKIRAMEIIEELERTRRGPYGGAVGYIAYTGNMDMCITIRTIMVKGETLYIQTGAGIVADSDPSMEYEETINKAAAMTEALKLAASDFSVTGR